MGDSLSTSLLLLLLALVLLWMAVTDKLSRVLDAYEVLKGGKSSGLASAAGSAVSTVTQQSSYSLRLPSLPQAGNMAQVEAV